MFPALLLALLLLAAVPARASETPLSGAEGHPRARFPLAVWVTPFGDAALDTAARRAVDDWNALFRETLGLPAFIAVERAADAQVRIDLQRRTGERMMGETEVDADATGVITLPVRIVVFEPSARGQTTRERLLYQLVAHELGHALGLEHSRDPRSVMCCVSRSIDFNDPAVREAYVEARRNPDLTSVRAQLAAHYERFWTSRPAPERR